MTQSYKSSETNTKKGHTIRVMKGKHIKWWWIALAVVLLAAAVIVIVIAANRKAPENTPAPESGTSTEATTESPLTSNPEAEPDYSVSENWAYFGIGEDQPVDLFLICPTVDMKDEYNMAMDDEETKASFLGALNMERGIYEESTRMYAPYYRQAAMKIYSLDPDEREPWLALAYTDVSAAFSWYLTHENNGRPIILAGFSQGADLCYRLLEEYFDDETLYDRLIAVYAIGWPCTQELVDAYPQIKPAQSAEDLGVVISFDCEAPEVSETFITPDGTKGLSINPLNWRTDGTPADKSENLGTCFTDYSGTITGEIPALCGCYLDEARGVVKVTDVSAADYPAVVPGLPEGAYHVYDYLFFYRNLQQNVKLRTERYLAGVQDRQPAAAATVQPGVGSLSREGYTLEQVVVLSRHNIRSPLSGSGSALGTITPHEWFQWSSNPSELSLRGGVLETEMGQYFRKWLESEGLFPENYHPTEDEVRVYANAKQRTIATAEYFVSGLLPTANTPIETHAEYDTMDPVFTPQLTFVSPEYNADAEAQVWELYGDTVSGLADNYALIADVIDMEQSEAWEDGSATAFVTDDSELVLELNKEPGVKGSLKTACSVSDALVLQYFEEPDARKAAFGHELTFEQWKQISEVKDVYGDVLFTAPLIAANVAHPLLHEIEAELTTDGRTFSFLCGHDSNVGSVLAALGAEDYELPGAIEKTPIGCKLVFCRWRGPDGNSYCTVDMVYETVDQLRAAPLLNLEQHPAVVPMRFASITPNANGLYKEQDFLNLLQDSIAEYDRIVEAYDIANAA